MLSEAVEELADLVRASRFSGGGPRGGRV